MNSLEEKGRGADFQEDKSIPTETRQSLMYSGCEGDAARSEGPD